MIIRQRMYKILKDGKYDGHNVGFLYIEGKNFDDKDLRLKEDDPEEEGYKLIFESDRVM